MKKKKINILVSIIVIVCSFFMSVCIYKINANTLTADNELDQIIQDKNNAYANSIKDMIAEENNSNSNNIIDNGQKVYTNFYELYANAENEIANAPSYRMMVENGSLQADVSVTGTPLGDMDIFQLNNTMNITQSRSKTGEEILIYQQYGDTPKIVSGMFNNQFYALLYKKEPVCYELLTKEKSETTGSGSAGKFTQMSQAMLLEKYKNDITDIFYTINEDTVKSLEYFYPAYTSSSVAEAKIILNTDAEYALDSSVKRATENYSTEINQLCNFLRPAVFKSSEITMQFSFEGKLLSSKVSEKFTVWYKFSVAGSSYECPIEVTSDYVANYSYKNYTISVSV